MIIINPDKIKRFKDRLFKKNASPLMQKGTHTLNPIATCQADPEGNIIVPTDKIIDFFFKAIAPDHDSGASLRTSEHFANLYTLFQIFTKEIDGYTFESDSQISEKDIQEATTKTTIEYLTKNLIITYFDNIRLEESGKIDTELLDKKFPKLIRLSSSGRDYRTLVGNTLEHLVETLENDDSWRKCIQNMNDAALVCNLVGASLPKIESKVVSKFLLQSRQEIEKTNLLLGKILTTKAQLSKDEANLKNYLKNVKKLDLAADQVLNKMNKYFSYAHNFMQLLEIPPEKFIGNENEALLKNMANLFLGYSSHDTQTPEPGINYSSIRFRMDQLFQRPELMMYCKAFKDHEIYHVYYINLFKLYYDEMADQLDMMISQPENIRKTKLTNCVFELKKIMSEMALDNTLLTKEKQRVQKKYKALVRLVKTEHLKGLIDLLDNLRFITHDEDGQFLEAIQDALVAACYFSLTSIDHKQMKADEYKAALQKSLFGYAIHYHPQRFFYQNFFETYVGKLDDSPVSSFTELTNTNKPFALMMLKILSDDKSLGQLLPEKHLEYAATLFQTYCQDPYA